MLGVNGAWEERGSRVLGAVSEENGRQGPLGPVEHWNKESELFW